MRTFGSFFIDVAIILTSVELTSELESPDGLTRDVLDDDRFTDVVFGVGRFLDFDCPGLLPVC